MTTSAESMSAPQFDEHDWRIYCDLWDHAKKRGIHVAYGDSLPGELGTFSPNDDAPVPCRPSIIIVRESYAESEEGPSRSRLGDLELEAHELLDELLTLAHEYGHYVSWKGRQWTPELREARGRLRARHGPKGDESPRPEGSEHPLTEDQCDLVGQEEERAWQYGRQALEGRGFQRGDEFKWRREASRKAYEELFWKEAVAREGDSKSPPGGT